jgi:hypothetical protein
MASAIVKEPEINKAQFYAESLINYYIPEYYQPEGPPKKTPLKIPMATSLPPSSTLHDTSLHSYPSVLSIS